MNPTDPTGPYDARYLHGVGLFNRGEFYDAHEVWEDLWREASGPEKQFYQGLIQCAVALEHARRGNVRGALRLAERYPLRLTGLPRIFMGVDIADFLRQMDRATRGIRDGGIESSTLPRIELASK